MMIMVIMMIMMIMMIIMVIHDDHNDHDDGYDHNDDHDDDRNAGMTCYKHDGCNKKRRLRNKINASNQGNLSQVIMRMTVLLG